MRYEKAPHPSFTTDYYLLGEFWHNPKFELNWKQEPHDLCFHLQPIEPEIYQPIETVPDNGSTFALLGLGILALATLRRVTVKTK